MQYLKEEENYSIEILNENFKELENKIPPPPLYGVNDGISNCNAGTSVILAEFRLPNNGNVYIVNGQVISQGYTGAVMSFQILGGLISTDINPDMSSLIDINLNSTVIARAGSKISIRAWCTATGSVAWRYAYACIS